MQSTKKERVMFVKSKVGLNKKVHKKLQLFVELLIVQHF